MGVDVLVLVGLFVAVAVNHVPVKVGVEVPVGVLVPVDVAVLLAVLVGVEV